MKRDIITTVILLLGIVSAYTAHTMNRDFLIVGAVCFFVALTLMITAKIERKKDGKCIK